MAQSFAIENGTVVHDPMAPKIHYRVSQIESGGYAKFVRIKADGSRDMRQDWFSGSIFKWVKSEKQIPEPQ